MFILGALINLSAIGAAAAGNAPFASSYFSPGFAVEIVAFAILGAGVLMKSKAQTPNRRRVAPVPERLDYPQE